MVPESAFGGSSWGGLAVDLVDCSILGVVVWWRLDLPDIPDMPLVDWFVLVAILLAGVILAVCVAMTMALVLALIMTVSLLRLRLCLRLRL